MRNWQYRLLPLTMAALALTGCATTEIGKATTDVALAGAGGVIGYKVSNGDPLATAAGAATGYLASKVVQASEQKSLLEAEKIGYARAMNQAVKQQYWIIQERQRTSATPPARDPRLVPVQIPETKVDGVVVQAHLEYLRSEP